MSATVDAVEPRQPGSGRRAVGVAMRAPVLAMVAVLGGVEPAFAAPSGAPQVRHPIGVVLIVVALLAFAWVERDRQRRIAHMAALRDGPEAGDAASDG